MELASKTFYMLSSLIVVYVLYLNQSAMNVTQKHFYHVSIYVNIFIVKIYFNELHIINTHQTDCTFLCI